jgi:hypothetical protein
LTRVMTHAKRIQLFSSSSFSSKGGKSKKLFSRRSDPLPLLVARDWFDGDKTRLCDLSCVVVRALWNINYDS